MHVCLGREGSGPALPAPALPLFFPNWPAPPRLLPSQFSPRIACSPLGPPFQPVPGDRSACSISPWESAGRTADGGARAGMVRFHDSQVVTTRGEKVVVEKLSEDWDGGSRGKVKSKGKRGKGSA